MTVIHTETGYLGDPYLEEPYLGGNVSGHMGHQASFVINSQKPMGMQCEFQIVNTPALGQQVEATITQPDAKGMQALLGVGALENIGQQANLTLLKNDPLGQQATFIVDALKTLGQQVEIFPTVPSSLGQQAELFIQGFKNPMGMQYIQTNIAHANCGGYLVNDYLEDPYLTEIVCASAGMQADFVLTLPTALGQQAEINIVDFLNPMGMQTEITIENFLKNLGMQAELILTKTPALGQQAEINIVDFLNPMGMQTEITIENFLKNLGMQAEFINQIALGQQVTVSLYNTTNLRILCSFPSRGLSTAIGLNAWGLPAGQGQNWKSNSTETGDFSPLNLNTDIVEEVWRSNAPTVTGINLDCDTERPQGVFLDTFAMLNHNITTSATVTLIGSNSPTFAPVGVAISLEAREDDPNIYYIAPTLPNVGYRYWRIAIDDISNPDTFVEVGTIIFGDAQIFTGECFVDQVGFQLKDYTDSVQTEAFTNVNNSRAQKKYLALEFRSLAYLKSNFRIMRSLFRTRRTVLKCLWIPTPSAVNQEYTSRFALFAKLVQIPNEQHNHKGGDADYVSFSIELDESK